MWPFGRRDEGNLGRRGEKLASRFLKGRGMKILTCNYRCPQGEADIIALDSSTDKNGTESICFVEVKTRSSDNYTDPEAAVNADKQRRVRKVADYYRATHKADDLNFRFDIVSIVLSKGAKPRIKHIVDAF